MKALTFYWLLIFVFLFNGNVWAKGAVPLTFSQGDVLSAEILNTILGRLNNVSLGFQKVDDLEGEWSCLTAEASNVGGCQGGSWGADNPYTLDNTTGVAYYKTLSSMTLTKTGNSVIKISSTILLGGCGAYGTGSPFNGPYEYKGIMPYSNRLLLEKITSDIMNVPTNVAFTKLSPSKFKIITSGGNLESEAVCSKTNIPPLPPTNLSGSLSGSTVSLSWTDQSDDETGFKIQTKTTVKGSWKTIETLSSNVTSTSITASEGDNWYRILSTSSHGDSITSNEIFIQVN